MKKGILLLVVLSMVAIFGPSAGEAASSAVMPPIMGIPNQNNLSTLDNFDLVSIFGSPCAPDHAVLFFDNTFDTAMGVILDRDGVPDPFCIGGSFIAADLITGEIWLSNDGFTWTLL